MMDKLLTDEHVTMLSEAGVEIFPTGSRHICVPPPENTDEDWLVVCPSDKAMERLIGDLEKLGFEWDGGEGYEQDDASTFQSWHIGKLNFIVTADAAFAGMHRAATHVCKTLNLLEKPQRILVFQAVLYGRQYVDEAAIFKDTPATDTDDR